MISLVHYTRPRALSSGKPAPVTQTSFSGQVTDRFTAFAEPALIYPSPNHPYLQALKKTYKLDEVIQGDKNTFEKAALLNSWVNNRWIHENHIPDRLDAYSILSDAQRGGRFPCFAYARVLTACLNAVGIPARSVGLKSKDVETRPEGAGHVVVEAYMDRLKKWVMFDPTTGAVFGRKGIPLNIPELRDALAKTSDQVEALSIKAEWAHPDCVAWVKNFIQPYLFYWDTPCNQMDAILGRPNAPGLMFVPEGAPKPTIFQIKTPIINMRYTDSLYPFVQEPVH